MLGRFRLTFVTDRHLLDRPYPYLRRDRVQALVKGLPERGRPPRLELLTIKLPPVRQVARLVRHQLAAVVDRLHSYFE